MTDPVTERVPEMVERVWKAIEKARCPGREGPYGLYDYSSYGHSNPHHVRDFRDPKSETWGHCVAQFNNAAEARALYERLTHEHIARAAIAAMRIPTANMINAGDDGVTRIWQRLIDEALR